MEAILTKHFFKQFSALLRLGKKAYGPYKKQILILTALGFIGGIFESVGISAAIPLLTSVLALHSPASDVLSVAMQGVFTFLGVPFVPRNLLIFIVLLFIAKSLTSLYFSYVQIKITTEYDREMRARTFSRVLRASWPYLIKQKLGNLETLLMLDVPISTSLLVKVSAMITLISSVIVYFIFAFSISGLITVITFVIGILIFFFMRPINDRVHTMAKDRATTYRDTVHHVSEHVSGLKTVKAMYVENAAIRHGDTLFEAIKDYNQRIQFLQQIAAQAIPPIGVIYIGLILSLAFKTPFISIAALPAVLYLIYRIFAYIQQMQNNFQSISEYIPHLERVIYYDSMADDTREVVSGSSPFSFSKEISFENVSFSYDGAKNVLDNVTLSIPKGSMVGIVGPSGAGKTTCVDLMLRLLEPSSGSIKLDGVHSSDIALKDWRRHIAFVSQDLFLIHGTIRDNIRFYDDTITDDGIWKAAEMARIADFIRECPEGLDTAVGDRGIMLSAGQRQRIVIARALARQPEVLILDEATSALDNESEAHIKRVIQELKGQLTIVAIAHRLSTIMDSDQLIVLQDGRVVETGAPKELLGNTNSYFYKVYTIGQ